MPDADRVVTANLPAEMISKLDEIAHRTDRSKSWIIRQALAEWIAEEQRRHELTLEALKSVDEGRTYSQAEIEEFFTQKKTERRARLAS